MTISLACWNQRSFAQTIRPVLHIIPLVDTKAEKVGNELSMNAFLFYQLANAAPKDMINIMKISLNDFDELEIVKRIRELNTNPMDTILFYYIGHGSYDADRKATWLNPSASRGLDVLYDFEILQEIKHKNVRLGVVVLDCCNREKAPHALVAAAPAVRPPAELPAPFMQSLFFDPEGLVLIQSSAPSEYALVKAGTTLPKNMPVGSIFTSAFSNVINRNKNNPIHWTEAVKQTQHLVDDYFSLMTAERGELLSLQNGSRVIQKRQTLQIGFYR